MPQRKVAREEHAGQQEAGIVKARKETRDVSARGRLAIALSRLQQRPRRQQGQSETPPPERRRRGSGLREADQDSRAARGQSTGEKRDQSSEFRVIALSFHVVLAGHDSRSPWHVSGILGRFFQKKGIDLSHRTDFLRARLYAALMALVAYSVMAQAPALIAQDAWTRQVPGSDVAAAYLTLRNPTTKPITIVAIESPVAGHAMIHETRTEGGQSQMRPHEQLVIAPGQTVKFEPGGLHVMLHGLTHPVAVGQSVPLVLLLADGSKVQVAAVVRPLNAP
jgi:copper(I)-binding protein